MNRCLAPAGNAGLARGVLALFLALATAAQVHAQTPMETAATGLAGSIVHSKQKTVAVFDFSGPDNKMTALGQKLADEFSAALAQSSAKLRIEDRSKIEEQRKAESYAPGIVMDPPSVLWLGQEVGAKAVVMGQMSMGQDKVLSVDLKAYRVDNGKGIAGERVSFPLDEEMAALLAEDTSAYGSPFDFSAYPLAKTPGYSLPRCVYCPRADYAPDAMAKRIEGVIVLLVIIEADGSVGSVAVQKGLPGGLNAAAIRAVKKWKLEPARGPDGKPVAVRQVVEVMFRMF
jgi:TonB family protein